MKWHLVYFVQGFMHPLWWLQSPEIITYNSVLVPLAHAIISMLVLAPMLILLKARPFICKQNKCIQFRQHLVLEYVCVGKQEIGLISDPSTKGHEIPPSSSIYTALRASFRLWDLFS